jgi:hypothetical protein
MSRQVKLVDTGEMSTNDVAFRAPNKKYFSSEEAYIKWKTNVEYKNKCIDKMFEIMGYNPKMVLPTYFFKLLKKYEDGVGYEAVYNTMVSQTKSIVWALQNKNFGSETAKVLYIMAIIDNNVMDEYKKFVKEKRENNGLKTEIINIEDINLQTKKQSVTNISKWLEDED